MMTAGMLGINVPESFIVDFGDASDENVLFATKRYDRFFSERSKVISGLQAPFRLHQEDFAQALGIPAAEKYEREGQHHLRDMFALSVPVIVLRPGQPGDVPAAEEPAADNSPKNIAYLNPSTTIPFWNWIQHGIEAEAEKYGYTVTTYDSNNDAATQLKNAQNVITQGVDAIIISPTDSASCPAVLQEAEDAGVPVVIDD